MPRANRHFVPGQLWHITHRCHEKSFLLKFARDRRAYLAWLFEARKRYGLCVLNYVVTSNHIHLLVRDTREGVIAQSMQLVAGRTGQQYNHRKHRQGAYWEDRYHATAVEGEEYLKRCLVYIDLNMVRAGVVKHPGRWAHGGYLEIQCPRERYSLVDLPELTRLCGFVVVSEFQRAHRQWIADAIATKPARRDARWSEAVAVGSQAFVEKIKLALGSRAMHREIEEGDEGDADSMSVLREAQDAYSCVFGSENGVLSRKNTVFWNENFVNTKACRGLR